MDLVTHTVTSTRTSAGGKKWDIDVKLREGEAVRHTFENPGVYEYHCKTHGRTRMCGVVLVGDAELTGELPCEFVTRG